jgi:hypothetical protein
LQFFYVKLTQPGWESFNGDFVGYQFTDGKSDVAIPRNIADRIAALVPCEILDTDGDSLGQGGAAARIASRRSVEATVGTALARQTPEAKAEELKRAHVDAGVAPTREFFTEDQLEQVAATEGIDGLRKLAEPWAVKDRSIPRLIARIVKAQNDFIAAKKLKEEETRAARAAALDEATRKRLEEESAFLEKARVIAADETPNAVGPDGKPVHVKTEPPKNEFAPANPEDPAVIAAQARALEQAAIEQAGADNSAANQAENEQPKDPT